MTEYLAGKADEMQGTGFNLVVDGTVAQLNRIGCPPASRTATVVHFRTLFGLLLLATCVAGQEAKPAARAEPILRVDTGGPSSFVTSLAFSPDGRALLAGGWDKVIRVWTLDQQDRFTPSPAGAFRVPLGPGQHGRIDALAISPDGTWLAVGGRGNVSQTGVADFRTPGWILPTTAAAATPEMLRDEGTIYLFNLHTRAVRQLRHHQGSIQSLAFSSGAKGPLLLASAAQEWDSESDASKGVVCLWNVQAGTPIAERDLPKLKERPQLSVSRTASALEAVRVAIAWGDGKLRVWDVQKKQVLEEKDGQQNSTAVQLDSTTFITGSADSKAFGQLQVWSSAAGTGLRIDQNRQAKFDRLAIPLSLALVASVPGQAWDHAAVALLELQLDNSGKPVPKQVQLRLVSLKTRPFATKATTVLWEVNPIDPMMPVLAAVAGGRHLAVGGSPNHEIRVYPISELLNGRFGHQQLASAAVWMSGVSFASKGQEQALLLRKQGSSADGFDFVFPFESGRIQSFDPAGGWRPARSADAWETKLQDNQIELYRNGERYNSARRLGPPPLQKVTAHSAARFPISGDVPIIAIASHDRGQPLLGLYNGQTGECFREYTGHTERITDVAFSPDSPLLASAAADQTVRVWSLSDLDVILGKRGLLAGVTLNQELKVAKIEADVPAGELLKVGDRLTGYITAGGYEEWDSARAFYSTWWALEPGTKLKVRRQRGDVAEDVDLPVGQAIDERKPLFSLLVTGGTQPADGQQWIGWNPLGPFESSDRRIERYLGWHFNTGDPERPTAFAELDQYRGKYFRRGLLRDLIRDGELRPAPAPDPLSRPAMSLLLGDDELLAETGFVVPQPLARVRLAVDLAIPEGVIANIALQVDGKSLGMFRPDTDGTWLADLPPAMWQRGDHRITAILKTSESPPQEFSERLDLRYVPASPKITPGIVRAAATQFERIKFPAEVQAGAAREPFDVELHRVSGGTSTVMRRWQAENGLVKVDEAVTLEIGANVFEVVAYNRSSRDKETRAEETSRERFVFTRFRGETSPPMIKFTGLTSQVEPADEIPLRVGLPAVVTTSRVRVRGEIASKDENLTLAEKISGTGQAGVPLQGFIANQKKQFVIDDSIVLSPGVQTLTYRARTESGKAAAVDLVIEYRPPLPDIEITYPFIGQPLTEFMEQPRVRLVAIMNLPPPADRHRCKPAVYVNGKLIDEKPEIDAALGTFQMSVPVELGDNDIEIRLENAWATATSRTSVSYRPAPLIEELPSLPESIRKPFMDFKLTGQTETQIDRVIVDGHPLPPSAFRTQGQRFEVVIENHSLEPEQEKLTVQVYAKDSPTPAIAEMKVPRLIGEPPPPAAIEVTDPQRDATITASSYTIRFKVASTSKLSEVEIRQGRKLIYSVKEAAALEAVEDEVPVEVSLQPGINNFEITARNDGGLQKKIVALNHLAAPVELVVKGFTNLASVQLVRRSPDSLGTIRFSEPATSKLVHLKGHVLWNEPNELLDKLGLELQVWVNGYRQPAKRLRERDAGGLTRSFEIPVFLSRERGNIVELGLPKLKLEADSRVSLAIDCQVPLQKRRLHLLVVAVDVSDKEALVARALQALKGKRKSSTSPAFTTPVFDSGIIYDPLTGADVKSGRIWKILNIIKRKVENLLDTEGTRANDVVLFYFQGGALVLEENQFFVTTQKTKFAVRDVIVDKVKVDMLSSLFEQFCGAQLLLMDVDGRVPTTAPSPNTWPTTSHAAMLRYAWLPNEPAAARAPLIDALNQVDPRSGDLNHVEHELQRLSGRFLDSLSYEGFVPRMLEDLELRRSQ